VRTLISLPPSSTFFFQSNALAMVPQRLTCFRRFAGRLGDDSGMLAPGSFLESRLDFAARFADGGILAGDFLAKRCANLGSGTSISQWLIFANRRHISSRKFVDDIGDGPCWRTVCTYSRGCLVQFGVTTSIIYLASGARSAALKKLRGGMIGPRKEVCQLDPYKHLLPADSLSHIRQRYPTTSPPSSRTPWPVY
jgi:hypothetical protein